MVQHRLQPDAAYIAVSRTVNGIAECHVVSGHRLRDGSGRAAHVEKPARYFLARTNLGKCPIFLGIQIDLERLLVRADIHLRAHTNAVAAIFDRRK